MNLYGILALIVSVIIFAFVFDVIQPIHDLFCTISEIPALDEDGENSPMYNLGIRLAYLIAIIAIFKIIFTGRRENNEHKEDREDTEIRQGRERKRNWENRGYDE